MKRFGALFLVVFFLMSGCSNSDKGVLGFGKNGTVVAKVGDKAIYDKQIDKFLSNLPPQVTARYGAARIRREITDGFVNMEILAWEARKRGIDKRDDVRFKMDMLVDQTLAREIEEEVRKGITVSDADMKKYYDDHQDRYGARSRIFAHEIMLTSEADAKATMDKIKKGGDFAALAKQYSKDPVSAPKGGDIGFVTPGKLEPVLDKAVFTLKEGEVSPVLKAANGYYIFKADKVVSEQERPFDQVKPSIENLLKREKVNKAIDDLKNEIRKKTEVKVNEQYFAQFKDTPPQGKPQLSPGAGPAAGPAK